ncbi:MAG TPA: dihydropyrimidinase, partial [Candidatus Binatia bacterium]|nr:dihydropyrimidinase [Candidatus Binatia bacterium]
ALVGGTTTLIEMCAPPRSDDALEGFELWLGKAEGLSACDFTFHMSVTKFDDKTETQLREIVKRGISSFKVYLAYKGAFGVDDTELYRTLKLAKELGVIVTAHCENETLIAERSKQLLAAGKTDPGQHHESRPPRVEAEGVHHLMTFAELTGAATYIVHLSCKEALDQAIAARQRGVRVSVETLIQYLTLDKTYVEKPKFEGAKYVMSPPLRDKSNQPVLWNGLRDGLIQTVATDHCPFDFKTQKVMGKKDFTKIPNGIPSLEDRINVLYTYGVKTGKIDLHTFVNCASTQAAKTFDLFPRKGTIQPGADADLVVFDPNYRGKISAKKHYVNVDYSVFEGWKIEGRPSLVTVRGQVSARDGKFVGKLGHGKFLKRKPSHF